VQEVEKSYGIPVVSVARLVDLIAYLAGNPQLESYLDSVRAYRAQYGIS
jgi:orotate phosphoribosyltransferase